MRLRKQRKFRPVGWLSTLAWFVGAAFADEATIQRAEQAAAEVKQAAESEEAEFIRFEEDDDGSSRLETAIVNMVNEEGVEVDLIGAVHIADAAYYEKLNALFQQYDTVLYELVGSPEKGKPLGNRAAAQDPSLSWIGALQSKMQSLLKLESQLQKIDYSAPNFVHADMSAAQFHQSKADNKESFLGLWLKAVAVQQSMGAEERPNDLASLMVLAQLLMKQDSSADLKRMIGREFDKVEKLITGMEAGSGTVIIGERNRVALEVLQDELSKGDKKIGIFYGAAHFPDMQKRLEAMGFKRGEVEWLTAWDMPAETETTVSKEGAKAEAKP